ncbi:MAG TPA: extracellular solute-binding protein [Kineosporiaceae bacterium]|nr:extracellular solute-binding protein [Kineosporiaceae bacterium]
MRSTRTVAAAVAAVASIGLLVSACGSGSSSPSGSSSGSQAITLNVNVFGDSFPPEMYRAYEKAHPGITIKENRADYGAHHNNLQAHLTAGAGLGDIEVIEIGQISGYIGQADKFVNFLDSGADTSTWTKAKTQQAETPDGKSLIGLPTDTGGLGLCYRTDLFAAAGLPTDRAAVSKLMPTWQAYVDLGKQFLAKAPAGVKWFDSAGNLFNGVLGNEATTYYDASGKVVAGTNPVVKSAWDLASQAIAAKESAALSGFTPEWNTGFQRGQFATVTCPAWMLAYIRTNAPETKGKWDVATVPGGSGNWGGSFLSVPKAGKHTKEAVELSKWLTAPAQDVQIFQKYGNFPSAIATWTQPEVANYTDPFFNNAPVGQIFPASLKNAPAQVYGPQWGVANTATGNALTTVEKGTAPDVAWQKVLKDIAAATGQ